MAKTSKLSRAKVKKKMWLTLVRILRRYKGLFIRLTNLLDFEVCQNRCFTRKQKCQSICLMKFFDMLYFCWLYLKGIIFSVIFFKGGLETEQDYKYEGHDEKCQFNKSEVVVTLSGAVNISKNETGKYNLLCSSYFF